MITASVFYTMIWNLFDFPCGVVRFGKESGTKVEGYDHQGDMVLKVHKQVTKLLQLKDATFTLNP